ncbi:MAG: hypothetical protein Q9227_008104 [Pyrenula ochraceoflavens]
MSAPVEAGQPAFSSPATGRSLPSRDVSDATFDDAFVAYILYCNPDIPLSTDSTELRKTFRTPPRSDGKNFSIFVLFELVSRLHNKELKTWAQLVTELGVEPPSADKGQSTQKLQQYAVRLKRWMRALHVDSFFEYLLGGTAHSYHTSIPEHAPEGSPLIRDGVPSEEDLALRALLPEWKPKRGRKRVEDENAINTNGNENETPKRIRMETPATAIDYDQFSGSVFPSSAIPFSAFPDDDESRDMWVFGPQSAILDGRTEFRDAQTNSFMAYPQSAILPRREPNEPSSRVQSAVDSKPKPRQRRRGPAVSSAWSSATGKVRGRPSHKTSQQGQFNTFPVSFRSTENVNQETDAEKLAPSKPVIIMESASPSGESDRPPQVRPSKLQLQVPYREGAAVRLATPPNMHVEGVSRSPSPLFTRVIDDSRQPGTYHQRRDSSPGRRDVSFGDISRALSSMTEDDLKDSELEDMSDPNHQSWKDRFLRAKQQLKDERSKLRKIRKLLFEIAVLGS